jgi:hypothetical protein
MYALFACESYEGNVFLGIFSTPEKAKQYIKSKKSSLPNKYFKLSICEMDKPLKDIWEDFDEQIVT